MESVNLYKGYSVVAPQPFDMEQQQQQLKPSSHPPCSSSSKKFLAAIIVASSLLILVVILVSFAAVFGFHHSPKPKTLLNSADDSIKLVCNVTQYPTTCISSISPALDNSSTSQNPDPILILKLSIQISLQEASKLSASTSNSTANMNAAMKECVELYDDATSRIGDALEATASGLTEEKVNDVQTWLSAALTDQETCLDGLEEMDDDSTVNVEEVKVKAQRLKEYVSNSLAIVANIHPLLQKFGLKFH